MFAEEGLGQWVLNSRQPYTPTYTTHDFPQRHTLPCAIPRKLFMGSALSFPLKGAYHKANKSDLAAEITFTFTLCAGGGVRSKGSGFALPTFKHRAAV